MNDNDNQPDEAVRGAMNATYLLLPEAAATVCATSKKAILEQLAERFAGVYGLDRDLVAARLAEREALGSTGFGRGVAIPHARVPELHRSVAVFLRLEAPVEFASVDRIPVDLVFGLLSPEGSGSAHLHALAAISRLMRDERMRAMLAQTQGAEALYGLLSNVIGREAA